MNISLRSSGQTRGFTLSEVLITASLGVTTLGLAMGAFLFGMKASVKDTQRLSTNADLRYFTAHLSKKSIEATGFYLFPSYKQLDGGVNLSTDLSADEATATSDFLYHGDCVVLEIRTDTSSTSKIRQLKVYYRVPPTSSGTLSVSEGGPVRYLEGRDYGTTGTTSDIVTLLNQINLSDNPNPSGAVTLVPSAIGNPRPSPAVGNYPIFCTVDSVVPSSQSQNLSINAVIVSDGVPNASSLNYTISPRGQK